MSIKSKFLFIAGMLLVLASFVLAGCSGNASLAGPSVFTSQQGSVRPANSAGQLAAVAATDVQAPAIAPETCTICHPEAGDKHQAFYDELYQDGVIQVADLAYKFTAPDKTVITFKMTMNGAALDAKKVDSLAIYFAPWTGKNFQFEPAADRLSLLGDLACDAAGVCTSTLVNKDVKDFTNTAGLVVLYGRNGTVGTIPNTRVAQNKYPFAALLKTGKGVDYVSAANASGCENCHTTPFLKHGYIYAEVNHDPATDFLTCKACHLDNGSGGHQLWQLLVDNPALAATYLAAGEKGLTPEQEKQYAYNTSLMNDVHMSHAMEFPYPQSMSNCATCHAGKLDKVLTDANFKVSTCKSCHPVTGAKAELKEGQEAPAYDTTTRALKTIMPEKIHGTMDLNTVDCTSCHGEGKGAPTFKQIHTGFDTLIYTADGLKYSDAISVTIDSATFDGKVLSFKFSSHQSPKLTGIDATTITPTVLVGLYGYDTKDFIIGPHERLVDDNADGKLDSKDARNLESVIGDKNPRVTIVSEGGGKWSTTADLSTWSTMILSGTVQRVEIGVIPTLVNKDGVILALNAPSRTFDLGKKAFDDTFYSPIVKVADGCNHCHDALATTFHDPDRGGNVVVCRMCHVTKAAGSHLELQSRSIDSYVHAIHSFQAFDIGTIDFADPVQAMEYTLHTENPYPTHGITDCESCHVAGTYNVPDQTKSLPGILSGSAKITGWDRNVGTIPSYITGPAARACGACHRAQMINEDAASELVPFIQHLKNGGYMVEAGKTPLDVLYQAIDVIMAFFN